MGCFFRDFELIHVLPQSLGRAMQYSITLDRTIPAADHIDSTEYINNDIKLITLKVIYGQNDEFCLSPKYIHLLTYECFSRLNMNMLKTIVSYTTVYIFHENTYSLLLRSITCFRTTYSLCIYT